jgi:hypothetical protein
VGVAAVVLGALCLVAAVWVCVLIARDESPGQRTEWLMLLVEAGFLVNLVLGLVRLGTDDHAGVSVVTWVGYLVASVLLLPVAYLWSASERSRGGTAVLLVALLVLPFLLVRLDQVWSLG